MSTLFCVGGPLEPPPVVGSEKKPGLNRVNTLRFAWPYGGRGRGILLDLQCTSFKISLKVAAEVVKH